MFHLGATFPMSRASGTTAFLWIADLPFLTQLLHTTQSRRKTILYISMIGYKIEDLKG